MKVDVAVIGGGVVGYAIAYELLHVGKSVAVIDKPSAGQATYAAAGMLPDVGSASQTDRFETFRQAANDTMETWSRKLLKETDIDVHFWKCGSLHVATDPIELAALKGMTSEFELYGIEHQWLEPDELRKSPPRSFAAINIENVLGAIHVANDAQLDNRRYLEALKVAVQRAGGEIVNAANRIELLDTNQSDVKLNIEGRPIDAKFICIAAGAWSNELLQQIGCQIELEPIRGQMFRCAPQRPVFEMIVHNKGRYMVPRKSGEILVGSTIEQVGFDASTSPDQINQLIGFVKELCPWFDPETITEKWAGLRPAIAQNVPFIGRVGNYHNLILATGHFRGGIQLSAISAEMAVHQMFPNVSERPWLFEWSSDSIFGTL